MFSRLATSCALSLCFCLVGIGQLDRTHIQGAATPYVLSSDYRALGFNPALLTYTSWNGDYRRVSGGIEGGVSIKSNLFGRSSLWDQIFSEQDATSAWDANQWIDALSDEELDLSMSFLSAAYARKLGNWGFAYANRRGISAQIQVSSRAAKLFTDGGLDLFSDIMLEGDSVPTPVEDYEFQIGDIWSGVAIDSEATLANLLEGTRLRYQSLRSHEFGLSRGWGVKDGGWSLHTGMGGRILLGRSYFDLSAEGGELTAFGARPTGLKALEILRLDSSMSGGQLGETLLDVFGPTGLGWGVDIGGVLAMGDRLWISASLLDIGQMKWEGEEYSLRDIEIIGIDPGSFSSTDFAIDPDNWLEGALGMMSADSSWFVSSAPATRVVSNYPLLAIGAGFRPIRPVVVAANVTARSKEAMNVGGWTAGLTSGVQVLERATLELGVQKATGDAVRIPVSARIAMKTGWEVGFRLADVSGYWRGNQSAIGVQTCFLRYRVQQKTSKEEKAPQE